MTVQPDDRPNLSLVVAHPRLVPWWIGDDLSPTEARRMLKALTSLMVVLAERARLEPGEVNPLLKTILEIQDTGDDRRDLQVGMEMVYDALRAHGL